MTTACNICYDDLDILCDKVIECPSSQHVFCQECFAETIEHQTDTKNIDFDAERWRKFEGQPGCPFDRECGAFSEKKVLKYTDPNIIEKYIDSVRQFSLVSGEEIGETRGRAMEKRIQEKSEAGKKILWIRENILTSKCPHCKTAWHDFDACAALTCSSCKGYFCAICLAGFRDDASSHQHVAYCTGVNDVFVSQARFKQLRGHIVKLKVLSILIINIKSEIRLEVALEINNDMVQNEMGCDIIQNLISLMIEGDFNIPPDIIDYVNVSMGYGAYHTPPVAHRHIQYNIHRNLNNCEFCDRYARYMDINDNKLYCLKHARRVANVRNIGQARYMALIAAV